MKKIIATLSALSLAVGVAIISFSGFQIHAASVEEGRLYLPPVTTTDNRKSDSPSVSPVVVDGDFLGVMNIPSINKKVNIFQGTDSKSLSKGAGHYLKSVMPGVADNSVLAGHRDTVFAKLGKVKVGAYIVVSVSSGTHIYQVKRLRIVGKNDRTVIVPTVKATLTLSTCYPFRYIGNAPQRYVVIAQLVEAEAQSI
jgi:sortase A